MAVSVDESLRMRVEVELGALVACRATRDELMAALEAVLACRLWVVIGDEASDEGDVSCPIAPGAELLGRLQSDVPVALATGDLAECLEYGARVIGIELVRERAMLEARWSFEADLLTELVAAGANVSEHLGQRARHAGVDLSRPWHLLLLETEGRSVPPELIAAARRAAITGERSMSCVLAGRLAVAVSEEPDNVVDAKLRDLHRVARGLGAVVRVGVSSAIADFACGLRQAEAALRLATCGRQTSTVYHEDLGSLRFLLNAPNQAELVALVKAQIGPLAEHDRERQSDLLETLRMFLDEGGNRRRAAERCHVHMSTMKYRLRRIGELLDCDLADANVRFDLMLALKVHHLLRAVDANRTTR